MAVSTYESTKLKDKNEVLNEMYWDFEMEKREVSEEYQKLQAKLQKSEAAVDRLKILLRSAAAKPKHEAKTAEELKAEGK